MKKFLFIFLGISLIYVLYKGIPENVSSNASKKVFMTVSKTNDIVELDLEEYLKGVLLAEMPMSFSLEALKAQAVASRTYTIKKLENGDVICDNSAHCQAWVDPTGSEYYEKISQAIEETCGEELTYLGEPIEAFFHSASGGATENSENVWSIGKPYLVSVESPGEEEIMQNFYTTLEITYENLMKKINAYKGTQLITTSKLKDKIKILSRTNRNHVKEIKIQNSTFSGTEIRNILELRSTNFNIELTNNSIIFNVSGYGHGVGMSQYGAEAMAKSGSTYKEILSHYYPGTSLEKYNSI